MKIFRKTPQIGHYGPTLGVRVKNFYQKVISYAEMFLLSKFGENRMKNEDFLKNAKNWPLGGAPGAGSKILPKIHFIYQEGTSVQIW